MLCTAPAIAGTMLRLLLTVPAALALIAPTVSQQGAILHFYEASKYEDCGGDCGGHISAGLFRLQNSFYLIASIWAFPSPTFLILLFSAG